LPNFTLGFYKINYMIEKQILMNLRALKTGMNGLSESLSGFNVTDYENYVTLFENILIGH